MPISGIDSALRRGLGFAAKVIGTNYDVYRLPETPNAANSIIDPLNLVFPNFQMQFVHFKPTVMVEQEEIYRMLYVGQGDTRPLKIGDVFVATSPHFTDSPDGRIFVFSDVQPLLPAMFFRAEVLGNLARPNGDGAVDEPILGLDGYQGESKFTELVAGLYQSMYVLPSMNNIATVIPVGIQPVRRVGGKQEFSYPTATHRGMYTGFIPLLPGIQVQPGDVLSGQNGERFVIQVVSGFTTGLQGYQVQLESLFT